jgi:hypothetical protein
VDKQIARQIYCYVVCVISLIIGIIYLCVGIYGVIKLAAPEFTMPRDEWKQIATLQSFRTDWEKSEAKKELTAEQLKIRWQDKKKIAIMAEKRSGMHNLINLLICFVVVIPVFLVHWKLTKSHS